MDTDDNYGMDHDNDGVQIWKIDFELYLFFEVFF